MPDHCFFLAHLPLECGDTAGGTAASDETDGGITLLDLTGNIQDLDLGDEGLDGLQRKKTHNHIFSKIKRTRI